MERSIVLRDIFIIKNKTYNKLKSLHLLLPNVPEMHAAFSTPVSQNWEVKLLSSIFKWRQLDVS